MVVRALSQAVLRKTQKIFAVTTQFLFPMPGAAEDGDHDFNCAEFASEIFRGEGGIGIACGAIFGLKSRHTVSFRPLLK
jgi:hypothetical protein